MATANELLQEFAIRHAVLLQGLSNAEVKSMLSILNKLEPEIIGRLMMESGSVRSRERLRILLAEIESLIGPVYETILDRMNNNLNELVKREIGIHAQSVYQSVTGNTVLPIAVYAPAPEQVNAVAKALPLVKAKVLSQIVRQAGLETMKQVSGTIANGYLTGEATSSIARNVQQQFPTSRRNVETIVRTSIGHFSATARQKTLEANPHIISALQWSSTLDGRTTIQYCIPRSGKLYDLKTKKPIGHTLPWNSGPGMIHWNCRSIAVAVTKDLQDMKLDSENVPPELRPYVAFRPPIGKDGKPIPLSKPASKMSVGEYTKELKKQGYSMDEIRKIRERMIGTVPASMSYSDWLKLQAKNPAGRNFVAEVLGETRARLFLDGKLPIESFSNNKGFLVNLADLQKRHAEAWIRAGLDTEARN